ncbi:MAG: acyl-CoA thioesterase [Gammaproteobacteria bacterium CG22_combo_CG10-13_8_21_14_all_40_8]|nr:MAG: acyl-CoA thioesterase [Gammaproteobacteria bacterium CG22_combo_CG10-13_8_21_14_all_40_8]
MNLRNHETEMTILVTPDMSNFGGNMHGGELLKLLDQVAYTCAMRYCGNYVVTLSVDNVLFKQPIRIGELLILKAAVNYTGKTSMEVGIRVISEDLHTSTVCHTNSSHFTMVAVDDNGKSTAIPTFTPTTDIEKKRWEDALFRKKMRSELQKQKKQRKSS